MQGIFKNQYVKRIPSIRMESKTYPQSHVGVWSKGLICVDVIVANNALKVGIIEKNERRDPVRMQTSSKEQKKFSATNFSHKAAMIDEIYDLSDFDRLNIFLLTNSDRLLYFFFLYCI